MERLSLEALARLVDEAPTDEEKRVLAANPDLRRELEALQEQTRALKDLPAMFPPPEGWHELEARLVEEGLVRPGSRPRASSRWVLQAAAGLILFLGGAGMGTALSGGSGNPATAARGSYDSIEEAVQAV
ncbi:MAG: hypothetical protein OEO23_15745, partial [Gemmatimonadota bacterium]|nr:hypothetical protein [Gemmatimonadota bacterium]